LPGQFIFSCLSHNIIVHEASHALIDRERRGYRDATNWDVPAFHDHIGGIIPLLKFRAAATGRCCSISAQCYGSTSSA
jgi:hypothetical protein